MQKCKKGFPKEFQIEYRYYKKSGKPGDIRYSKRLSGKELYEYVNKLIRNMAICQFTICHISRTGGIKDICLFDTKAVMKCWNPTKGHFDFIRYNTEKSFKKDFNNCYQMQR